MDVVLGVGCGAQGGRPVVEAEGDVEGGEGEEDEQEAAGERWEVDAWHVGSLYCHRQFIIVLVQLVKGVVASKSCRSRSPVTLRAARTTRHLVGCITDRQSTSITAVSRSLSQHTRYIQSHCSQIAIDTNTYTINLTWRK